MMPKRIYLDHAATTPLDPKVFKVMKPYFSEKFGNSMSFHSFGQEALKAVDKARSLVAKFLHCRPQEIIFTSGATESNNIALKGVVEAVLKKGIKRPHIITSSIEHHCILETCHFLEKKGTEVTYLPVSKEGLVNPEDVKKAIKENTVLVSIMYVNNEIGTIQPIVEIGKIIKRIKALRSNLPSSRLAGGPVGKIGSKILFHTDAVQAANYLDCNVNKLGVDLLSLSAHKFYGPKGVGILYIKLGTPILPIQHGGVHEYNLRAGTLNVPGIVGIGKAITLLMTARHKAQNKKIKKLQDKLIKNILNKIPRSQLNGSKTQRIPAIVNFSFRNVEGESILLKLDFKGIACSTGSACASGSLEPSHVLMALGIPREYIHGSIRFSLGKDNTRKEIEKVLKVLPKIIKELCQISPYNKK